MKKLIAFAFYTLIMIGIAGAFILGEVMTSQEFRSRIVQDEDICSYLYFGETQESLNFYFECLTVERLGGDSYEVVAYQNPIRIFYSRELAEQCLSQHTKMWCWENEVKPAVLIGIREHVSQVREDIERKQQRASPRNSQLNQLINFTMEEINR